MPLHPWVPRIWQTNLRRSVPKTARVSRNIGHIPSGSLELGATNAAHAHLASGDRSNLAPDGNGDLCVALNLQAVSAAAYPNPRVRVLTANSYGRDTACLRR